MNYNLELGNYSNYDFRIISEWIAKNSKGREKLVVALQFSVSDIKYAPRIQYLIEKQVNCIVSKEGSSQDKCNIRFFVLSDIANPACCLDVLNIKKSHSDLVIHFGYSCYHNISNFHLPVHFVPSSSDYFDVSESNTFNEITCFLNNKLNYRLSEQNNSTKRINVILSFQGILKSSAQTILLDEIRKSDLTKTSSNVEIFLYQLSPINVTDYFKYKYSEFICDLPLAKLGHDKDLKLNDLEKECFEKSKNMAPSETVMFFHFISKDNEYVSLPNSFVERIILRYNQLFEIFLCKINRLGSRIELCSNALDELSSIISKRFVFIEKAKSINSTNRVAFIITPGITQAEWKLIEFFKRHHYRRNVDNGNKIKIETHIISLTGVNEVKLRNFPDIDIFCFFGCSEYFLSHIVKNFNLKIPIILTPFEYQVFLGVTEWSTCYLNVSDLRPSNINDKDFSSSPLSDSEDSELDQDFSKLSIKDSESLDNGVLVTKSVSFSLQNIDKKTKKLLLSLSSIKNRHESSYFGLNPLENTGHIPTITQGRDGIASMYENEMK
ncbi:diphthamide biosynthesis 2 isoform X1 [Cryptosporidium sp. chipmunk genotype I]|uniref:diphthamide biosynthesis 2 isoform X1 n=1 Tax=Cryptosporidium sp. chipmunk genotype I TaxID=1280935 RepID=UPI003519E5AB|nr:diphthamide biosynthesis 2 isoform X1 [Cryptosporidium sp. chipmunk genotype I]